MNQRRADQRTILAAVIVLIVACCAPSAQAQRRSHSAPLERYVAAISGAQDVQDYEGMAAACQAALADGYADEYVLRSLSWALCREDRPEEGLSVAIQNWQTNPCPPSLVQCIAAAADAGRFDLAREAAREAERIGPWGGAEQSMRRQLDRVAIYNYRFTWTLRREVFGKSASVTVVVPQRDEHVQTRVSYDVFGAKSWQTRQTADGIVYLQVVPDPAQDTRVVSLVRMEPFSWRPYLAAARDEAPPAELQELAAGRKSAALDQVLAMLRGASQAETAVNIVQWIEAWMPWTPVSVADNSPDGVLKLRLGSCTPRSYVADDLLRRAGIPARAIRGQGAIRPDIEHPTAHTVPQFYIGGLGWIDADFGAQPWQPRVDFLRMYYRNTGHKTLGDTVDPAKDCRTELISREL